jgi:mono/diheme cytochrome c family protein
MQSNPIGSSISGTLILRTLVVLMVFCSICLGQTRPSTAKSASQSASPNDGAAARGEYIVNNVAVCSQCHTPRDGEGRPEQTHWLEGAALWLQSAEPVADWPLRAPRIAGALPGTDDEMIILLTTGIWRTGTYLRPPMPQFRMTRQDAEAVVAFLKTVKPAGK